MAPHHERLTLEALLADPLTQLVMRSDGITSADVANAFAMARTGLAGRPVAAGRVGLCTTFDSWLGQGTA